MELMAHLLDGKSAQRQRVRIITGHRELVLHPIPENFGASPSVATKPGWLPVHPDEAPPITHWPYKGLRLAEKVYAGQPVRLHHKQHDDAVLVFEGTEILTLLQRVTGKPWTRGTQPSQTNWRVVAWIGGLSVLALGMIFGLTQLTGPLARITPTDWVKSLGGEVAEKLAGPKGFCEGSEGMAALEKLTNRLVASRKLPYAFRVRVSHNTSVNAFAAPGGEIVFLKGLIDKAESPEEVAGVLAHEIAHALERHPTQNLFRVVGFQIIFSLLMGGSGGESTAAQFGQVMLITAYTRDNEASADRIGIELLNDANILGSGLADFFNRISGGGDDTASASSSIEIPEVFSTHPGSKERMAMVQSLAKGENPAMEAREWAALKSVCD